MEATVLGSFAVNRGRNGATQGRKSEVPLGSKVGGTAACFLSCVGRRSGGTGGPDEEAGREWQVTAAPSLSRRVGAASCPGGGAAPQITLGDLSAALGREAQVLIDVGVNCAVSFLITFIFRARSDASPEIEAGEGSLEVSGERRTTGCTAGGGRATGRCGGWGIA